MPQYRVDGHMTVSCFTLVEAESPEAAIVIARNRSVADMLPPTRDACEEEWEPANDGEPTITHVELQS